MIKHFLRFVQRLSPDCRESAHLISKAAEHELSRLDRIGLRMHLLICRACRNYERSIRILGLLIRTTMEKTPAPGAETLSEAARTRILQKLEAP